MKNKKIKRCMERSWTRVLVGIKKATSYERVKGRLGYRFYNDEFLQAHLNTKREEIDELL
jgi:hypothetical protein